jgi:hypothetical protein
MKHFHHKIDDGARTRQESASRGEDEMKDALARGPLGQDAHELALFERLPAGVFGQQGDADTLDGRAAQNREGQPARRMIIASARGGIYTPGTPQAGNDFHEPHLRALFRFIGIDDIAIVRAEGVAISPEHREAALKAALAAVSDIVAELAPAVAA